MQLFLCLARPSWCLVGVFLEERPLSPLSTLQRHRKGTSISCSSPATPPVASFQGGLLALLSPGYVPLPYLLPLLAGRRGREGGALIAQAAGPILEGEESLRPGPGTQVQCWATPLSTL